MEGHDHHHDNIKTVEEWDIMPSLSMARGEGCRQPAQHEPLGHDHGSHDHGSHDIRDLKSQDHISSDHDHGSHDHSGHDHSHGKGLMVRRKMMSLVCIQCHSFVPVAFQVGLYVLGGFLIFFVFDKVCHGPSVLFFKRWPQIS